MKTTMKKRPLKTWNIRVYSPGAWSRGEKVVMYNQKIVACDKKQAYEIARGSDYGHAMAGRVVIVSPCRGI